MTAIQSKLEAIITAETSGFDAGVRKAEGTVKQFAKTVGAVAGFASVGMFGREAMKAASDFEERLRFVNTIAGRTEAGLKSLGEQSQRLAILTGKATKEINDGLYQALSAGIPEGNLLQFTEATARAAVAGMTDLPPLIEATAKTLKVFGKDATQADGVLDAFTKTVESGILQMGDLSTSFVNVGGFARSAGADMETALAVFAELTKTAGSAAQGGTRAAGFFRAIAAPTAQAAQGAKALGVQFNSAALESMGLAGFLAHLQERTGGTADKLRLLFNDSESLAGAMALLQNNGAGVQSALENISNASGTTAANFASMTDTTAHLTRQLRSGMEVGLIAVGDSLNTFAVAFGKALFGLTSDAEMNALRIEAGFKQMALGVLTAAELLVLPVAGFVGAAQLLQVRSATTEVDRLTAAIGYLERELTLDAGPLDPTNRQIEEKLRELNAQLREQLQILDAYNNNVGFLNWANEAKGRLMDLGGEVAALQMRIARGPAALPTTTPTDITTIIDPPPPVDVDEFITITGWEALERYNIPMFDEAYIEIRQLGEENADALAEYRSDVDKEYLDKLIRLETKYAEEQQRRAEERAARIRAINDALHSSIVNSMSDMLMGIRSVDDAIRDLGKAIASMLVRQAVSAGLGAIFPGGNIVGGLFGGAFASGGIVGSGGSPVSAARAPWGGRAVPIIAHVDEPILNPRQMANVIMAIGNGGVAGGGSSAPSITAHIHGPVYGDREQLRRMMTDVMAEAARTSGPMVGAVQQLNRGGGIRNGQR
jgi:TP901 family phage tail tape measure protein